ncbi:bifunctional protein FolD 1, mitochondrial-like isoform X1 [Apium graveolens]|uniref:bifunctional protein FolD 1, mitochondrial-like isoform X1 n=1 Tax=Apium graveolens TaxID=4045 RepID=UPI003D7BF049
MLAMGRDPLFIPCAPKACIELLLRQGTEIASSGVVVLGKSKISGLPISLLLQSHLATVSTLHTCSDNLEIVTRQADIIVSDVGIPDMVRGHWLKPEAVVIDMGAKQVEVAAVDRPKMHLWESGIMRITRHPQMVGQVMWCLTHTIWIRNSIAVAAFVGLIGHNLFGV